jgi:hypothetical protein
MLPLHAGGDLSPGEALQVESHLKDCASCREEATAYEKTWRALEEWDAIEPSPAFNGNFWEKAGRPGFLERLLSLFDFRIPAWSAALLIAVSFFAGYNPSAQRQAAVPAPPETQIVYLQDPEVYVSSTIAGAGQGIAINPVSHNVLDESGDSASTEAEIQAMWDDESRLQRMNLDNVFSYDGY